MGLPAIGRRDSQNGGTLETGQGLGEGPDWHQSDAQESLHPPGGHPRGAPVAPDDLLGGHPTLMLLGIETIWSSEYFRFHFMGPPGRGRLGPSDAYRPYFRR